MMWQADALSRFKARSSRCRYVIAAVFALLAGAPLAAEARDLDLLMRLLVPGFLAQDFAAICVADNPVFLPELKYGAASVAAFAQHLKIELTSGLTDAEARSVLVVAATTAREAGRKYFQEATKEGGTDRKAQVKAWCDSSAKGYILQVMNEHDKKHTAFDKIVADAKK